MADCNLETAEIFLKNWHFSFIGPYCSTFLQHGKRFICTSRLFYTDFDESYKMCVVASARIGPSVLGKECIIIFKKCP